MSSPKNMAEAIVAVMAAVGTVEKSGENKQQGYSYVGEKDVVHAVRGAMIQAGLSLRPVGMTQGVTEHGQTKNGVIQWRCDVTVIYELRHTSGDVAMVASIGSGVDTQDKAPYKAMTGAYKYAIFHTFAIERADADDAEKDAEEPAPRPQQQQYRSPPQQQSQPQRAPQQRAGSRDGGCPKCGGATWDNREKKRNGEMKPNAPDFKCRDQRCGGVIWPRKPTDDPPRDAYQVPNDYQQPDDEPPPPDSIPF